MTPLVIELRLGSWKLRSTRRTGENKPLADCILHPRATDVLLCEHQRLRWGEYRNDVPPRQVLKSDCLRSEILRRMVFEGGFRRRVYGYPGARVQRPQAGST